MVRKKLTGRIAVGFAPRKGARRPAFVDYKDVGSLNKMCTGQGKLFSRKRSGTCAALQWVVSVAVKVGPVTWA